VAEQPTPVARHDTLRAMVEEDAFDINTTDCGPHRCCALFCLPGALDEPIDEDAMKLALDAPGLNIHATTPEGQNVLWGQCSWGRSRSVELLLADGRIDPNQWETAMGESPLHIAANLGRDLCVKILLSDPRVDPNLTDIGS
jgi:ankyrin repeat protein